MKKSVFGLCCLLLTGCGEKREVMVEAELPSVGTQEITVVYTTVGGNRAVTQVAAFDGKFDFSVECADSTEIELFTANKRLLGAFLGRKGEELVLSARGDSLYIDGREVRREFDTVRVTELPTFPELELFVSHDSVATFKPEGVWFFTASDKERTPQVLDSMKAYKADRVRDVYISPDRYHWDMINRKDSVKWVRALMPDAPVRLQNILTSTPCLIEVDTAGTVLRVQKL